ncbi:hypothetical protein OIU91_20350 [Streptomyces sp. NBC_01456]|uniref:hypothetical protein n=1 Tax=unclassified Streptomyces TaxID=2593676 RepID=UPI002E33F86C|nr:MULTISPECIES: hypothetical protein [unclassified Streptomyces]
MPRIEITDDKGDRPWPRRPPPPHGAEHRRLRAAGQHPPGAPITLGRQVFNDSDKSNYFEG